MFDINGAKAVHYLQDIQKNFLTQFAPGTIPFIFDYASKTAIHRSIFILIITAEIRICVLDVFLFVIIQCSAIILMQIEGPNKKF